MVACTFSICLVRSLACLLASNQIELMSMNSRSKWPRKAFHFHEASHSVLLLVGSLQFGDSAALSNSFIHSVLNLKTVFADFQAKKNWDDTCTADTYAQARKWIWMIFFYLIQKFNRWNSVFINSTPKKLALFFVVIYIFHEISSNWNWGTLFFFFNWNTKQRNLKFNSD